MLYLACKYAFNHGNKGLYRVLAISKAGTNTALPWAGYMGLEMNVGSFGTSDSEDTVFLI